ncbi:transposase, partial [Paracoccus sp. (in: a-proteobacteria)]|uniref:transposase n=1 Tax=Paracoccus sp. TaxID=267 RepID=UPI00396C300B
MPSCSFGCVRPGKGTCWTSTLFRLTEAPVARLRPFLLRSRGRPPVDDLQVLRGIVFVKRHGLRWCDAPREQGLA